MDMANLIFGTVIVLVLGAGAFFALRLGKVGPSSPKTGGQVTDPTTSPSTDNERGASLDKQKTPAAE